MDFIIGKTYHGFLLQERTELEDIHSIGYLFYHTQSGARVFYVENKEDNKVFFISFKTPPTDDCGTPHILEHSVLCGSEKYQAKDPFNELAKGSLHTYLNALTYGDKTMYPVASRNEQDFRNMMQVYLDAVFFPRIYEKKEIFMQEGWHYELEEKDAPLSIKGVVYNEMKGALSDPEAILGNAISRSLFPNSIYGFESGGDPEAIPTLTYENFLAFHKKLYHPSNSYIYLYGDMEIEKQLELLDTQYLSHFTVSKDLPEIMPEQNFEKPVFLQETFPVGQEEDIKQTAFLSYNVRVGASTDPVKILGFQLLSYILLETNASPLKKALVEAGIAEETEGWFDSSSYDMVFSIIGKKAKQEDLEKFCAVIEDTLREIVKNGLDKNLIESTLNHWEFYLREENFGSRPKGLTYGMQLMKSWLHGGNPAAALQHWKHFEIVKSALTTRYFETMIETLLLENQNKSFVVAIPEKGKQVKQEADFAEKMEQYKKGLSSKEIEKIIAETKALEAYQKEGDSQEILEQIPFLNIEDIEKNAEILPMEEGRYGESILLYSPLETNGIVYTQLLFDTSCVPEELLPYVGVLTSVLGKLDTKEYSYEALPMIINFYTGGISLSNDIYIKSAEGYRSFVAVNGKVLAKNIEMMVTLFRSILFTTDFTKLENLKKIIKATKINFESYLQTAPHLVGILRSLSHVTKGSYLKEKVSGISFYHFLVQLEQELEQNPKAVVAALEETAKLLFTKENLTLAVACEKEQLPQYQKQLEMLYQELPKQAGERQGYGFTSKPKQEAFVSSSKVQYNIQSCNFTSISQRYSGEMAVLKTILDLEYLWNVVRVQGGAYGCGSRFLKNGNFYLYSYRDPNIQKTYDAFAQAADFLETFCKGKPAVDKYILGTINTLDRPQTIGEKFDTVLARYFQGVTPELQQREREEVLSATVEGLQEYVTVLRNMMAYCNICTVGNETTVQKEKERFSEIAPYLPTV